MIPFLDIIPTDVPDFWGIMERMGENIIDSSLTVPDTFNKYDSWRYFSSVDIEAMIEWMNTGGKGVILASNSIEKSLKELDGIALDRTIIHVLDEKWIPDVKDFHLAGIIVSSINTPKLDNLSKIYPLVAYFQNNVSIESSLENILPISLCDWENLNSQTSLIQIFVKQAITDRPDKLFATSVVNEQYAVLGIVYSSKESLHQSIVSGKGTYYSRSRKGIWIKGETSGATQSIKRIVLDCDKDAVQFVVKQDGSGFCHKNTSSCFGNARGIWGLEETLKSRLKNPIEKSYTNRLFTEPDLLHSKILEEADELVRAKSKDEIAWETADLIYFALTKCVSEGVSIADIERHLDIRSCKVTRRPGNAKEPYVQKRQKSLENTCEKKKPKPQPLENTCEKKKPKPQPAETEIPKQENPLHMRVFSAKSLSLKELNTLMKRPVMETSNIMSRVIPIIDAVKKEGDSAVLRFTEMFDKVKLDSPVLLAPFSKSIIDSIPKKVRQAVDVAIKNVETFHQAQLHADSPELVVETMPGVLCSRIRRPIEKVGLYIPGGSAVLPSTAVMLGVPAKVAGCTEIIFATPPRSDGSICPEVLYVAHCVGAKMIVMAGGAQAIAAMAYGTKSVPKVDKICGPGNQYVTAAKMYTQNDTSSLVSIDMPAGPSELLVIADETSNLEFVVSDLLSQAEHGPDSQVVLLTVNLDDSKINKIQQIVSNQTNVLPRASIISQSLTHSYILKCKDVDNALEISNLYAPEHLILHIADARKMLNKVQHAGSVFVGSYSPESCGDYASGTNHTLPTYGYARMYSGVNTNTFVKHITAQELSRDGLNKLGDAVSILAGVEELHAHKNAVDIRLKEIRGGKGVN